MSGETDHAGVVTFHRLTETSSRVTVQLEWEPSGAMETIGAAIGVDDHAVKKDLTRFKEFIEARRSETGSWRDDID